MKALVSMKLQPAFRSKLACIHKAEPVLVSAASSIHNRPVEIRQYLRYLRENRQYNFTKDFVY